VIFLQAAGGCTTAAGEIRVSIGVVDTDNNFRLTPTENRILIVVTTPHATPGGHERFATI